MGSLTFVLLALAASPASAQTCSADTDCPQGFACVVSGTSTPPTCKGTSCPADAGSPEPIVYSACQPKACTTDADCGAGMVCYAQTSTSCSGSGGAGRGCAANTPCDAGPVVTIMTETCTTTTRNLCAFKWQLPCNADSDCGDGFVCQPSGAVGCGSGTVTSGSSSGSTGTSGATPRAGSASPPSAADAGAPECTATPPSYPGWCSPKSTTCTTSVDCPSGWTCTAIGTPAPATAVDGGTYWKDGSVPTVTDAGGGTTWICVGPSGIGAPTRGTVDVGGTGPSSGSGHVAGADAAVRPPTQGPGAIGGAAGKGETTSGASGGGCAIAPAQDRDGLALLVGLPLLGLALRRRSRR